MCLSSYYVSEAKCKCQCVYIFCEGATDTELKYKICSFSYLCVDYVVLDLLLCDGDMLQNDLQPHRHHAGHPVDQAGADVTGHPPLEQQEKNKDFTL